MAKKSSKLSSGEKGKITRWFHAGMSISDISAKTGVTPATIKLRIAKTIRDDTQELWSLIIRQKGRCEISGYTGNLQAHHLLEKSAFPHLRYDLNNGICLTDSIHEFDKYISPHSNSAAREAFRLWLQEHKPEQYAWWDKNRNNKFTAEKAIDNDKMLEIYAELKAIYVKGLENNGINILGSPERCEQ